MNPPETPPAVRLAELVSQAVENVLAETAELHGCEPGVSSAVRLDGRRVIATVRVTA